MNICAQTVRKVTVIPPIAEMQGGKPHRYAPEKSSRILPRFNRQGRTGTQL